MRRLGIAGLGAVLMLVVPGCRGTPAADPERSVVRLAGEVCRVELIAGGVFVAENLVLTAAHPVAGVEGAIDIETPTGTRAPAVVVGFDPARDLAALRVDGFRGEPLVLADGTAGQQASIWAVDRDARVQVVDGVVERLIVATGEDIYREGDVARSALQLAAQIESGMSGAPVIDERGRVVGIVFASSRSRPVTYAVTAAEARAFLDGVDTSTAVDPGRCP